MHALQQHFRPLNEDIRLSLQWRTLQQSGDINAYRQQVYLLRTQFPFGEVAEFCLAYHGLKKELRPPVLTELWKTNARYLPLAQLFELAAQAEVTSVTTLFPRLADRLRQEESGRHSGGWNRIAYHQRTGYQGHRHHQAWPPPPRVHQSQYPSTSTHHQHHPQQHRSSADARNVAKTPEKKTEDQSAWMRKRPCWICDKTGHLIRECTKKKPSGCPRCGKDHQLKVCPARPKATIASIGVAKATGDRWLKEVERLGRHGSGLSLLQYRVKTSVGETSVVVDTGAQLSLMAQAEADRLKLKIDRTEGRDDVSGPGGEQLTIIGSVVVTIDYGRQRKKETLLVAHPLRHPVILGLPWVIHHVPTFDWNDLSLTFPSGEVWSIEDQNIRAKGFGMSQEMKGEGDEDECLMIAVTKTNDCKAEEEIGKREFASVEEMEPVLTEYGDVFAPLEGIPPEDRIQHGIDLVQGARPVMKRPYRLAEAQ